MNTKNIKLLFITQKIHQNDDDLAFVILWIKEFMKQGVDVQVVCLEKGDFDGSFPVYSLGKEVGAGKTRRILRFLKYIFTLEYNRVFVHMNPEYVTLGGWYWFLKRIPIYLWYTHYTMHIHLFLSGVFCKYMFAATAQSLPQFNNSPKKIVTGHGIDISYWLSGFKEENRDKNADYNLLSVHRICRSKRLELAIKALKYLPEQYNLTVYGRDVEENYYKELQDLVSAEHLGNRIFFKGPVPMEKLKNIYPNFRVTVNMASETIDKTILEAMLFGLYPITTPGNSKAIGLPIWPTGDSPENIAEFILKKEWNSFNMNHLQEIVKDRHSLSVLITKINKYII